MNGNLKVKPSELGLGSISYKEILNGKMSKFPMVLQQQAVLKAYHDVCTEEGNNEFIPVSAVAILKKLKKTPIKDFLPGDADVKALVNRGWLKFKDHENYVVLTDYAKHMIIDQFNN